ncbi:MAG: hypothetical protein KC432_07990 [Thermomicrobiales bacterium]|nr:hypothetical protein [Thermomicrobiales bacterium]
MATALRFVGLALGMVAVALPLVSGGVVEAPGLNGMCDPGAGICGDALVALQSGGDRIVSLF